MNRTPAHDHDDEFHRGLVHDLGTLVSRRRLLTLFAGTGAAAVLVACGSSSSTANTTASTDATAGTVAAGESTAASTSTASKSTACAPIPEETAGPYPGDGSNGVNVLDDSGIVRSDITSSFGSSTTVAAGVPLTIALQVTDTANGCAPLAGAAVYLWHCNIDGKYSMYSEGVTDENYLRGVQATDADGNVTFTSIFPAAYDGRWPHIHFEVYPSIADISSAANTIATSQLALPADVCNLVYATDGYGASVQNLSRTSLATDNVFSDGADQQLATVTGDVSAGFLATLGVAV